MSEKKPLPEPPAHFAAPPPSYADTLRLAAAEKQSDVLLHLFLALSFLKSLEIDPAVILTEPNTFGPEYAPQEVQNDPEWFKTVKSWISAFLPADTAETEKSRHKRLQCQLTLAARRFIIFVSALDLELASCKDRSGLLNALYPPIDVLFCWYSFMLRPRTFLHEMRACSFEAFTEIPFPLERVASCINKTTLLYEPEKRQREAYVALTQKYVRKYDIDGDMGFEVPETHGKIKVFCPCCGDFLALVDLTNSDNTGFADSKFRSESSQCRCGLGTALSHNSLQIRQLYQDTAPESPGSFIASFHPDLSQLYYHADNKTGLEPLVELRHHVQKPSFADLASHQKVSGIFERLGPSATLIARHYGTYNLVHATISQYFALPIHTDLVGAMFHALEFVLALNKFRLLTHTQLWPAIEQAEQRYKKFLRLHGGNASPLVPTVDIELVWRTRRLDLTAYFEDCLANAGRLVNYDTIDSSRLYAEYNRTAVLYRKKYKEKYTSCGCDFCKTVIKPSFDLFKKPKVVESLVKWQRLSFDHLSFFDQVDVHVAEKKRVVTSSHQPGVSSWARKEKFTENFAIPYRAVGGLLRERDFRGVCAVENDWLALREKK